MPAPSGSPPSSARALPWRSSRSTSGSIAEAPNSLVVDAGGREDELAAELMAGSPSIVCVPMDGKLVFCLETVAEEDDPRRSTGSRASLPEVLALSEADVRSLVGPEEALECMRTGFAALPRGALTLPANMDFAFPTFDGEAHLKGAHIHGSEYWAVKAATGFWGNPDRGLAVTNGLFLVFSAETGILAAILFDNGYLTELRTGAAGALAADLLAPAHVEQAAIVGAGGQARYQLEALLGVRRPQRVVVASRSGAGPMPTRCAHCTASRSPSRQTSRRPSAARSSSSRRRRPVSRSCSPNGCSRARTSPRWAPTSPTSRSSRRPSWARRTSSSPITRRSRPRMGRRITHSTRA